MRRLILSALACAALAGCANNWAKYYSGNENARTLPFYDARETGPIKIYRTVDPVKDRAELERQGYTQVGFSSFNAGSDSASEKQLRVQAEKIGAHVVLTGSNYTGTVTGAMPLTLPTSTTSYTSGRATVYGAGGPVTVNGSGTTTTYGTETTMVPYSVNRSDFGAAYFVKVRFHTGIVAKDLEDSDRQLIGSNKGVRVRVVINGSPAFLQDVLVGDIILTVSDDPVFSGPSFSAAIAKHQGSTVTLKIRRGDKELTKTLDDLAY